MAKIKKIIAREVLTSRGLPTVEAEVHTDSAIGRAIVPSGASTGIYEACELRDKKDRYHKKGVLKAVANVSKISQKLSGMDITDQAAIDKAMIDLDGTQNKSRLGANAILSVSMACTRAAAESKGMPLYKYLNSIYPGRQKIKMPVPFCNIINGGKHAGNELKMQEFMIAPIGFKSFSLGVRAVSETYHTLKKIIEAKYGKNATNVGDEGGFAPPIENAKQALTLITKAIADQGYAGKIKIAMDPAASEFHKRGIYSLNKQYSSKMLEKLYLDLMKKYDIISLEDPFDQDDFEAFKSITRLSKAQIVGDDLLVTNPGRIQYAIDNKICNALLLKVNQIGTITESMQAARMAIDAGWNVMVSHRSGETEDPFIADLAVAIGCGQAKIGAPCRSDRTAKFNQLLRIEEEL